MQLLPVWETSGVKVVVALFERETGIDFLNKSK